MVIRVLFVPSVYTSTDVTGISMVQQVIGWARKLQNDTYWYIAVPYDNGRTRVLKKGFVDRFEDEMRKLGVCNVSLVEMYDDSGEKIAVAEDRAVSVELIKKLSRVDMPADVVMMQYSIAGLIKSNMPTRGSVVGRIDVPYVTVFTDTESNDWLSHLSDLSVKLEQLRSILVSDVSIAISDVVYDDLITYARKYLSSWAVNEVRKKLRRYEAVYNLDRIFALREKYEEARKSRDYLLVYWSGSCDRSRLIGDMINAVKYLNEMGFRVKLRLRCSASENSFRSIIEEYLNEEWLEYEDTGKWVDYLMSLDADVGLYLSPYPSLAVGLAEWIASGMIPIVRKSALRKALRGRIPEDYPFVYDGGDYVALAKMIEKFVDMSSRDRWRRMWFPRIMKWLMRSERVPNMLLEDLRALKDRYGFRYFSTLRKFLSAEKDELSHEEAVRMCESSIVSESVKQFAVNDMNVRKVFLSLGYDDIGVCSEIPSYRVVR